MTAGDESNVAVVRRGYEAFSKRDLEIFLPILHPEVEFFPLLSGVETAYRGHDGMRRFIRDMDDAWESWHVQPQEFQGLDDFVVVMGFTSATGRGSGIEVRQEWGHVFRLRNGKVWWSKIYADRDEARREAGLDQ